MNRPPPARSGWWRWLPLLGWIAAIFVASSIPGSDMPRQRIPHLDKLVHGAIYAVLGGLALHATRRAPPALAIGVGYGVLDELHQRYTPGRQPDGWDLLADTIGVAVGVGLCALLWVRRSRRQPALRQ